MEKISFDVKPKIETTIPAFSTILFLPFGLQNEIFKQSKRRRCNFQNGQKLVTLFCLKPNYSFSKSETISVLLLQIKHIKILFLTCWFCFGLHLGALSLSAGVNDKRPISSLRTPSTLFGWLEPSGPALAKASERVIKDGQVDSHPNLVFEWSRTSRLLKAIFGSKCQRVIAKVPLVL